VFVVHGTCTFIKRAGPAVAAELSSTTKLGSWYATALFWKPQVALFVNELTLLPVLTPLAPAGGVIDRFPDALAAHGVQQSFFDTELAEMAEHRLTTTKNRSVVGVMNEFCYLGGVHRRADDDDLVAL